MSVHVCLKGDIDQRFVRANLERPSVCFILDNSFEMMRVFNATLQHPTHFKMMTEGEARTTIKELIEFAILCSLQDIGMLEANIPR